MLKSYTYPGYLMTTIESMDPRKYSVQPATIDQKFLEDLRTEYLERMQRIGKRLANINALPIMEEPKGSGQKVTAGNYSMRVLGTNSFFITGNGVNKKELSLDGMVYIQRVNYEEVSYAMTGAIRPSREVLVHEQIYNAFPETNIILHTHDALALQSAWRTEQTTQPIFFATLEEAREVVGAFKHLNMQEWEYSFSMQLV